MTAGFQAGFHACCLGRATFSHASYAVRLVPSKKLLKRRREHGCDGPSKVART